MLTWSSKHGASYGTPMPGLPPRTPPCRGEKLSQEWSKGGGEVKGGVGALIGARAESSW